MPLKLDPLIQTSSVEFLRGKKNPCNNSLDMYPPCSLGILMKFFGVAAYSLEVLSVHFFLPYTSPSPRIHMEYCTSWLGHVKDLKRFLFGSENEVFHQYTFITMDCLTAT